MPDGFKVIEYPEILHKPPELRLLGLTYPIQILGYPKLSFFFGTPKQILLLSHKLLTQTQTIPTKSWLTSSNIKST